MTISTWAARIVAPMATFALLGCAQPSFSAHLLDVAVLNRATGERLVPYRHGGKLYIAGTPGEPYAIELRSARQQERLLAVVSVDGVNVLTGQTADIGQSGYVIDDWQAYAIQGWRKSMDNVAQFVFTALPNSYAAQTGRPDNVGVIGVAVFRERGVSSPPSANVAPAPFAARGEGRANEAASGSLEKSKDARAAAPSSAFRQDAMQEPKKAARLGTGHGEREYSPTQSTEFVRASATPQQVITLHYDSRSNLIARGIIRGERETTPQPFPRGFVPDPPMP